MKSINQIIEKIDKQIEREIRIEKTLSLNKKSVRYRRLELIEKEIEKIMELNKLLELLKYRDIVYPLKTKDTETKQLKLNDIPTILE